MDATLIEYLNSGEAWLLVGSGPSIEVGVPTWPSLADAALGLTVREGSSSAAEKVRAALEDGNYPLVFERAATELGLSRVLQVLRPLLAPQGNLGTMYRHLARWPAAVYMTTNFDQEINRHLVAQGEAFQTLSNSADHMNLLLPDATGLIVKLHGDLTSEQGLVLTSSQYQALSFENEWQYWRTRMTSIFQMNRVIVIGYSLTDEHIRAALEAAKRGSIITREVCWLAPGVRAAEAREYLEKYKVRIVSYPSLNGDHRGLGTLLHDISKFVPARTTTRIRRDIQAVVSRASRDDAAATAVFVFNRLSPHVNVPQLRVEVAVAALEAHPEELRGLGEFSLAEALAKVGWLNLPRDNEFEQQVVRKARRAGLLVPVGSKFRVADDPAAARNQRARFELLRRGFRQSVELRIRRDCPDLSADQATMVARDLDDSLTGFFREGGLTLATLLFSPVNQGAAAPVSIVSFITEASARYDELTLRHAFWHAAVACFVEAGAAERGYLGRLAQGFFAFHAVGAFGDVAIERLRDARETVWVLDSNVQIPALAAGAPSNRAYVEALGTLRENGVRLFTTARLFDEVYEHLGFARQTIRRYGSDSPYVIQAAGGQPPFRRQNEFLQGFIRWQAAGNPSDWNAYLFDALGHRDPGPDDVVAALARVGIEVVEMVNWPGFLQQDYGDIQSVTDRIKDLMRAHGPTDAASEVSYEEWLDTKVPPEAEAYVIVQCERQGRYHINSDVGRATPTWFVSSTAVVNALNSGPRVTWRPEAFLAFVGTLVPATKGPSSDRAFEVVLWSLAEAGINPISEETIQAVFNQPIDQAMLKVTEQREALTSSLGLKYSEPPELVLRRLPPSRKLLAALQLSNEVIQVGEARAKQAEEGEIAAARRAKQAEAELGTLTKFKRKYNDRQAKIKKRTRSKKSSL